MSRYSRQERFRGIGPDGQARLGSSRVLVAGVGALGSALAETMVRAGVGSLTVVDRDFVEESNLQRQSLFEEADAALGLPKAVAAEARLRRLNSEVVVRGLLADLTAANVRGLVAEADLVLDGTDNFDARFLLNDACLEAGKPWVYGACVGAHGLVLAVRPRRGPCLRCVLREPPAPGTGETCETAGVIAPIVQVVAGIQAAEGLKILAGRDDDLLAGLVSLDLWAGFFEVTDLRQERPSCPACREGDYAALRAPAAEGATLCGRDAVQLPPPAAAPDLPALAARLRRVGEVRENEWLLRFAADDADLVVFKDGRVLVKGTADLARARALCARYVGM